MNDKPAPENDRSEGTYSRWKLVVLGVLGLGLATIYVLLGDSLSLANLAERESQLRDFQEANPFLVYGSHSQSMSPSRDFRFLVPPR